MTACVPTSFARSPSYRQLATIIVCTIFACFVYWNVTQRAKNPGDMPYGMFAILPGELKNKRPTLRAKGLSDRVEIFSSDVDYDQHCTYIHMPGRLNPAPKICTYDPKDDFPISPHMHSSHTPWDPQFVKEIIDFMRNLDKGRTGQKDGVSLVDIGCQIGSFTVLAAASGFEVVAVDALSNNLQFLSTTIRRNNFTHLVTVVHNAVSDRHEDMSVQLVDVRKGRTYVQPAKASDTGQGAHVIHSVVKAIVFDDLIPLVHNRHVVIKIDIEASEGRALRVAERFFQEKDVACVLMEWLHVKKIHSDRDYIINFLSRHGFRAFPSSTSRVALLPASNMSWPPNIFWLKR